VLYCFFGTSEFLLPFCGEKCGSLLLSSHVFLSQRIIFVPFELLERVINLLLLLALYIVHARFFIPRGILLCFAVLD
jgi:hypothetical protein